MLEKQGSLVTSPLWKKSGDNTYVCHLLFQEKTLNLRKISFNVPGTLTKPTGNQRVSCCWFCNAFGFTAQVQLELYRE